MNVACRVAVLASISVSVSADTPLPTFSEQTIEVPTLSLADSAKAATASAPRTISGANNAWTQLMARKAAAAAPADAPKLVSRMPVVVPTHDIAPGMIKTPKAGVDYKLTVKEPDVAIVK